MEKIPKHAIKVFSGILHDVYHWQQEMYDGTFSTFEALKRKPSVTIIAVTIDQKILINYEEQPFNKPCYCLPGGIAESDDLLSEAMRELKEETGYESSEWSFYTKTDVLQYSKLEWESYFFVAKGCRHTGKPAHDNGENIKVTEYDFLEFLQLTQQDDFSNDFISALALEILEDTSKLNHFKSQILGIK